MSNQILSQSRLKEVLRYNPETGIFTNKINRGGTATVGKAAGCYRPDGYLTISIDGAAYLAHRLAFLYVKGQFPEKDVDHINHIRDKNQWVNLRQATNKINCQNNSKKSSNTSGITGVSWCKGRNKWMAYIGVNDKTKPLGRFTTLQEAASARRAAEIKYGFHPNHGK